MNPHISLRGPFILSLLPAVTFALLLTGCGKTDSEEKAAGTIPASVAVANPRATFTADPNPVTATDSNKLGVTKLTWSTTATKFAEIHVLTPNGTLLCTGRETGSCATGQWVANGMTFYLQDSTAAKPTDPAATLAAVVIKVQ
jgi:hypothetical protein